jgi:hypothetical protein
MPPPPPTEPTPRPLKCEECKQHSTTQHTAHSTQHTAHRRRGRDAERRRGEEEESSKREGEGEKVLASTSPISFLVALALALATGNLLPQHIQMMGTTTLLVSYPR